ncbi:hypothetical protein N9Y48_04320 [Zobellia sp.]|nr:hypothetical protein [Zobellia sp.]
MTTTQQHEQGAVENDKNAIIVRLQRNQKDLVQLRTKLDSYRCEPKTYLLYERIGALRSEMDSLSNSNEEIILTLRNTDETINAHLDLVNRHLTEFRRLNDGVEEYLSICCAQEYPLI